MSRTAFALGQHPPELVRVEAAKPRPQAVVGRHRRLRLKPDEVLERVGDRHGGTPQEELALEQRAVELALPEHLGAPNARPSGAS